MLSSAREATRVKLRHASSAVDVLITYLVIFCCHAMLFSRRRFTPFSLVCFDFFFSPPAACLADRLRRRFSARAAPFDVVAHLR